MRCDNCDADMTGVTSTCQGEGGRRFCGHCAAFADALRIGSRAPILLYDDGRGSAVGWTGGILGTIVRHQHPARAFASVRYRVRMLDGSLWWGHGPTRNGTYIRLRPMKGA